MAPVRLVAITGGSGAGKSWLASRLHTLLGEKAARLTLDDFYRDRSHLPPSRRVDVNFDHPDAVEWPLFETVLQDCLAGRATYVPRYDFRTHCRLAGREIFRPRPVLFVDGLWLLLRPPIRRLFHLKVFIECAKIIRLRHRLARDGAERGRDPGEIRRQFQNTVEPMHRRYVAPQARWADLVLHQPFSDEQARLLHERIWDLLRTGSLLPAWMRETFRAELTTLLKAKQA